MAVGFRIDFLWYQIGQEDFLHAFFSTICYRLEQGNWGSKYPHLMNKLYQGELAWEDVKSARKELDDVSKCLKKLKPSDVIWDIDDIEKQPPWENKISHDITDMSNYFVTSDGRDLIAIIFKVFDDAEEERIKIEIVSL